MNQDLSILHLVVNASFIVQLVMLLLLIGSITSWAQSVYYVKQGRAKWNGKY